MSKLYLTAGKGDTAWEQYPNEVYKSQTITGEAGKKIVDTCDYRGSYYSGSNPKGDYIEVWCMRAKDGSEFDIPTDGLEPFIGFEGIVKALEERAGRQDLVIVLS